jgi:hypothetical protein
MLISTERDAKCAGFEARKELLGYLKSGREGTIHRSRLRLAGPDPRWTLRQRDGRSEDERSDLQRRLARYDAASPHGPWTAAVMRLLTERPGGPRS